LVSGESGRVAADSPTRKSVSVVFVITNQVTYIRTYVTVLLRSRPKISREHNRCLRLRRAALQRPAAGAPIGGRLDSELCGRPGRPLRRGSRARDRELEQRRKIGGTRLPKTMCPRSAAISTARKMEPRIRPLRYWRTLAVLHLEEKGRDDERAVKQPQRMLQNRDPTCASRVRVLLIQQMNSATPAIAHAH
jgi:hypothetical protein